MTIQYQTLVIACSELAYCARFLRTCRQAGKVQESISITRLASLNSQARFRDFAWNDNGFSFSYSYICGHSYNGISPLFYALGYCAYDLINYADDGYKRISSPDTSYSITYKLIKSLVSSGVDINQVNDLDCTPLLFATFQKDTSLIDILCKLGANPNKTTQIGVTPLIYAIQEGSYGAKTNDSSLTKSYYQQAIEEGNTEISKFLNSKGLKTRLKPKISGINIYSGFTSNESCFMVDFGSGIYEPLSKMLINLGFQYRLFENSALITNPSSYDIFEKRFSVYLSFQHLHLLKNIP